MDPTRIYIYTNDGYDDPAMHRGVQTSSPPTPLVSTPSQHASSRHTLRSSNLLIEKNVAEGDSQSIVIPRIIASALEGLSPRAADPSATPLFMLNPSLHSLDDSVAEGYQEDRVTLWVNEFSDNLEDWLSRVPELPLSSPQTVDQVLTHSFYLPSDDMNEDGLDGDELFGYILDHFPMPVDEGYDDSEGDSTRMQID